MSAFFFPSLSLFSLSLFLLSPRRLLCQLTGVLVHAHALIPVEKSAVPFRCLLRARERAGEGSGVSGKEEEEEEEERTKVCRKKNFNFFSHCRRRRRLSHPQTPAP